MSAEHNSGAVHVHAKLGPLLIMESNGDKNGSIKWGQRNKLTPTQAPPPSNGGPLEFFHVTKLLHSFSLTFRQPIFLHLSHFCLFWRASSPLHKHTRILGVIQQQENVYNIYKSSVQLKCTIYNEPTERSTFQPQS